jgi:hypothetical protein
VASRVIARAILVAALLLSATTHAAEPRRPFILDRGSVEIILGQAGWRTGVSPDEDNPGFRVLGGGSEVVLGLDIVPGIGIIVSGRVLAAPRLSGTYIEGLAGVGAQIRLSDWVRLRAGIASGQARLDRKGSPTDAAILIGGFIVASVDLFRLVRGRAAVEAMLRFDVDGHLLAGETFPRESVALSGGAGFRF